MAGNKKVWVYSPPKAPKPKVTDEFKKQLTKRIEIVLEKELRPKLIQTPEEGRVLDYVSGIHSKWHRNNFYICGTMSDPQEKIAPYEAKFSRMEYVDKDSFNLAYMRHTGKFWEVHKNKTLEESIRMITTESPYIPLLW